MNKPITVDVIIVDKDTGCELGTRSITRARLAYLVHTGMVVITESAIKVYI